MVNCKHMQLTIELDRGGRSLDSRGTGTQYPVIRADGRRCRTARPNRSQGDSRRPHCAWRTASNLRRSNLPYRRMTWLRLKCGAFSPRSSAEAGGLTAPHGSHRMFKKEGWDDYPFSFHDPEELGPVILAKIAKKTGLRPEEPTSSPTTLFPSPSPSDPASRSPRPSSSGSDHALYGPHPR